MNDFEISEVRRLVSEVYIPFAEEERTIAWPGNPLRAENDAEHSFSLAVVGMALGEQLGMNPEKIAYYATIHDLPELIAGDTSVWDDEGRATKAEREAAAIGEIGLRFAKTPILERAMKQYEAQTDEEARFVYALDKLLAVIMIVENDGYFWKRQNISYDMHREKAKEMIKKVSAHPVVLGWYEELLDYITDNKAALFNESII